MSYCLTGEMHNDPYCFKRIEEEIIGVKKGIFERMKNIFK
jgi:hypothetical protein